MTYNPAIHLLQFAPRFAANPTGGAELRNHHLAKRLSAYMKVTHVGFSLPDSPPEALPADSGVSFVPVPRVLTYKPLELVRGLFGSVPFSVLNYVRPEMAAMLAQILSEERFDIVQLESIHLAGYLPIFRAAKFQPRAIVCDWHNIESEILERYADNTSSIARRLYARRAARKLRYFERRFVEECDLHVVVSERDRDMLLEYGSKSPVVVIENGIDIRQFPDTREPVSNRRRILFVGAMDYHANVDAALFLAREIWPEVARSWPDAILTIVGRSPTADVRSLAERRIEVTGTVADVRPYYREALVAVAPLRVGGGTRLKILEAMAAGVPVVSTSLGAEGLAARPGEDYLLADSGAAIAQAIVNLLRDSGLYGRIAAAGNRLVRERYDWGPLGEVLAQQLLALVR